MGRFNCSIILTTPTTVKLLMASVKFATKKEKKIMSMVFVVFFLLFYDSFQIVNAFSCVLRSEENDGLIMSKWFKF